LQNERRRSLRLGPADPRTNRRPMAQQEHRGAHALEFQAHRVNGAGCALTKHHPNRSAHARRRWPTSNRNAGRLRIGTGGRLHIGMHGRLRRNMHALVQHFLSLTANDSTRSAATSQSQYRSAVATNCILRSDT